MKLYSLVPSNGDFQKSQELSSSRFPEDTFVMIDDTYIKYDTQKVFKPQSEIICDGKRYKYSSSSKEDKSLVNTGLENIKSYIWTLDIE